MGEARPWFSGHLLCQSLAESADREVLLDVDGTSVTGAQLADLISVMIDSLANHGVTCGTPIALLSGNRREVLAFIGAGQLEGYRRTALHPMGSVEDHAFVLQDAAINTLVIDPAYSGRASQLQARLPDLRVLTFGPAEVGDDLLADIDKLPPRPLAARDLAPDHPISITYTGGTTGRPKGVIGTADSLMAMAEVMLREWEWPQRPRFLMCTPLSHAGAAFFTPVLALGGSVVVAPRFDPDQVLDLIEREQINATMLVPTMLYALLGRDLSQRSLGSLETIFYGAAAINPARLSEAIERIGPVFAQYYGQSECPMVISYLAKADHTPGNLGACGRPTPFLRTSLRDSSGEPVPDGEPGEIWVSGRVVAAGYWNRPEETEAAFGGGWLRTGDVAVESSDGVWTIVDRVKDMIVTGGFNVFSREIEDAIAADDRVLQVAVVGLPDERWGEAVTAFVVLKEPLTDALVAALCEAVRRAKGPIHVPKAFVALDALPLTGLGKVDKVALRDLHPDIP